MTMIIPRVQPVNSLPKSKHSTEDPNERRRRQLLLTYGYRNKTVTENAHAFKRVLQDTVEISEEGRKFLEMSKRSKM